MLALEWLEDAGIEDVRIAVLANTESTQSWGAYVRGGDCFWTTAEATVKSNMALAMELDQIFLNKKAAEVGLML